MPYDPDQSLLFPPNLKDWLPSGHLAYFILDLIATLDLKEIYAHYDFKPVVDEKGNVIGECAKSNRGRPAYDPRMMTSLLLYGYVTGTVSSRQLEKKCQEDVAFRVLSANQKPDHETISEFRRVHLKALAGVFLQVLKLCQKAGLVKLGHVALDGTKVKANASKHKAMSYGYMQKREDELKKEIDDLMRRAEQTDHDEDDRHGRGKRGDELPDELARRESRLKKIQEAKAALEAEVKAEAQRIRQGLCWLQEPTENSIAVCRNPDLDRARCKVSRYVIWAEAKRPWIEFHSILPLPSSGGSVTYTPSGKVPCFHGFPSRFVGRTLTRCEVGVRSSVCRLRAAFM